MRDADLAAHYRAYLAALDERRFGDLERFVHDELAYNGERMTRAGYAAMIAASTDAAPELQYRVGLLVVAGEEVACRLEFDCLPRAEFLGLAPTGRRVRFAEHAFYRFRDGRIAEVASVIDRGAVARQLAG